METNLIANPCNISATFTTQDLELLKAYRRIQKFRIKKPEDVKAGWIYNVRYTHAMEDVLCMKMNLLGKPKMTEWIPGRRNLKVARRRINRFEDSVAYEHVSTLIAYNQSYRLNSKVEEFVKLLKAADRFQQYCILKDKPYDADVFLDWEVRLVILNGRL